MGEASGFGLQASGRDYPHIPQIYADFLLTTGVNAVHLHLNTRKTRKGNGRGFRLRTSGFRKGLSAYSADLHRFLLTTGVNAVHLHLNTRKGNGRGFRLRTSGFRKGLSAGVFGNSKIGFRFRILLISQIYAD